MLLGFLWAHLESNQAPTDYESVALTEWAIGPLFLGSANIIRFPFFAELHPSFFV